MKEIDFKVWDKRHNKFIVLHKLSFEKNNLACVYERNEQSPTTPYAHHIDNVEVMEYTGFKDDYGTKIYEYDIIAFKSIDNRQGVGYARWEPKEAMFVIISSDSFFLNYLTNIEVLGNLKENPNFFKEIHYPYFQRNKNERY